MITSDNFPYRKSKSLVAGRANVSRILQKSFDINFTENELVCDGEIRRGWALPWPDAANQVHRTPAFTTPGRLAV
jgi:hypothetical protein